MDFIESFKFTFLNTLACWNPEPFNLQYPKVRVNISEPGFYEPKPASPKLIPKTSSPSETTQLITFKTTSLGPSSIDNEPPSTQAFNFDSWIKGEGPTLTCSQNKTPKAKVSWNMLKSNDTSLDFKAKKPLPSSFLVPKSLPVPPPIFISPIPVPELFDVKRCCPSYFFPELQRQKLCSQGWFEGELPLALSDLNSFNENMDFSQFGESSAKHLQEYKNYQSCIEKKSCYNFDSIGSLAQAQIVYRYYAEILYPSFSKDLPVVKYINISCHRLVSLLKDLAVAPQAFVKNTTKMEIFLKSLHEINPKACLFLFHYLSSIVLDFIEIPEENYTDESVWRKVALWLNNLQPGNSDLVLKTHFIQRCPRILEQTFKFPEDLDKKQTLIRHGFRSSLHLSRLQEFLLTSSPESNISSESSNESLEENVTSETEESSKNKDQISLDTKPKIKTPLPEFPDFEDIEISDAEDLIIDDSTSPMLSGICLSDAENISNEIRLLSNINDSPYSDSDKPILNPEPDVVCNSVAADQVDENISINVSDEINSHNNEKPLILSSTLNEIQDKNSSFIDNDLPILIPASTIESSESDQAPDNVEKTDLHSSSNANVVLEGTSNSTHIPTIIYTTHFLDPSPSISEVESSHSFNNVMSSSFEDIDDNASISSEKITCESTNSSTSYPNFPNIFSIPEISDDCEFESDEVYSGRMHRLLKAYAFIEGIRLINKSC